MAERCILVVDDADDWRSILTITLSTIDDVRVLNAPSGERALEMIRDDVVELIVTDLRMDGISGLDLLTAARELGRWPCHGAMVISGEDDPELERRALDCGASAFFPKPFSAGAIRRHVISLLNSRCA